MQEIAQVHIVRELPKELGLGRIFAGANLNQLGVVHKNKAPSGRHAALREHYRADPEPIPDRRFWRTCWCHRFPNRGR